MKEPTTIFDPPAGAQTVDSADSADFTREPTQISGRIVIAPSAGVTDGCWSSITKSGIESCLQEFFREAVKVGLTDSQGITFGPTAVDRFAPGTGDRSVGYALKITAAGPDGAASFFSDFIFVVRDRAEMQLFFTNTDSPLDRTAETGLAQKVYDRIGAKTAT